MSFALEVIKLKQEKKELEDEIKTLKIMAFKLKVNIYIYTNMIYVFVCYNIVNLVIQHFLWLLQNIQVLLFCFFTSFWLPL